MIARVEVQHQTDWRVYHEGQVFPCPSASSRSIKKSSWVALGIRCTSRIGVARAAKKTVTLNL
jgi:hypothetical protein